jgi:hypothetical protein
VGSTASDTTAATPAASMDVLNQFRMEKSPVEAAINTYSEMNFYLIALRKSTRQARFFCAETTNGASQVSLETPRSKPVRLTPDAAVPA